MKTHEFLRNLENLEELESHFPNFIEEEYLKKEKQIQQIYAKLNDRAILQLQNWKKVTHEKHAESSENMNEDANGEEPSIIQK